MKLHPNEIDLLNASVSDLVDITCEALALSDKHLEAVELQQDRQAKWTELNKQIAKRSLRADYGNTPNPHRWGAYDREDR